MPTQPRAAKAGLLWALPGGAWGAWVGFRGIYQVLPHMNGDTAAPVFVWGMYAVLALIGLVIGSALSLAVGLGIDWPMQRLRAGRVVATGVAALGVLLVLWLATQAAGRMYPGLRALESEPRRPVRSPAAAATGRPVQNPCAAPPPKDARERASWDLECR
jgi:hypothetical protein